MDRMREHDAAAATRFPGPDYYHVLGWIHEILRPATYVEIGVGYGESLRLAISPTVALGIDPCPLAEFTGPVVVREASRDFFARHDLRELLGAPHFSLAFLDGSHLIEDVAADLLSLERYASPASLVLVHDTIPLDEETSSRTRATEFYTGDVWKIAPLLAKARPELEMAAVRTAPSGLTMIRGLGAGGRLDPAQYLNWGWNEYLISKDRDFRYLDNTRDAVSAWLHAFRQHTPVQSMRSSGA